MSTPSSASLRLVVLAGVALVSLVSLVAYYRYTSRGNSQQPPAEQVVLAADKGQDPSKAVSDQQTPALVNKTVIPETPIPEPTAPEKHSVKSTEKLKAASESLKAWAQGLRISKDKSPNATPRSSQEQRIPSPTEEKQSPSATPVSITKQRPANSSPTVIEEPKYVSVSPHPSLSSLTSSLDQSSTILTSTEVSKKQGSPKARKLAGFDSGISGEGESDVEDENDSSFPKGLSPDLPVIPSGQVLSDTDLAAFKAQERINKRVSVMTEIVETEESYVKKLQALHTVYAQPLMDTQDPDAVSVTANIVVIKGLHETLLEMLKKKSIGDILGLAEVFEKHSQFLKMYTTYLQGYENKIDVIKNLKKRSTCREVFEKARKANAEAIESLMVTPVQRVPRYILLFKELLKCTDESSPEHAKLKQVYNKIEEICSFINSAKKTSDGTSRMVQLQNAIIDKFDSLLIPGRILVREAEVTMKGSLGKTHRVLLFLFNDMIIWVRAVNLQFKGMFRLDADISFSKKESAEKAYYGLVLSFDESPLGDSKTPPPTSFLFKTEPERNEWIDQLNSLQTRLLEKKTRQHGLTKQESFSHGDKPL